MAGKLPDRPRCPEHPYERLSLEGTCVLCVGAELGERDFDRHGRKKKNGFNMSHTARRKRKAEREAMEQGTRHDLEELAAIESIVG